MGGSQRLLFVLVCYTILIRASAQLVGVDICACQPTVITFRLNFTFECDDTTVAGIGINDTACQVDTRGNANVTDFVPRSVSTVQIFEINENKEVVGDSTMEGRYVDGSEISYTSIVEREPSIITPGTLPLGFEITLTGINAAEQPIVNIVAIEYTGECGIFPLLEVGEQIGWILFTDLGDPADEFCPASTTSPPIFPPTIAPLDQLMSEMPSNTPTAVPLTNSEMPSSVPTASPVVGVTESPIETPTATRAPACPPVDTGGKSGIVNGEAGSGVKGEFKHSEFKTTEDMDRFLRTGGGEECPEVVLPATNIKKNKENNDKSPKDNVPKGIKRDKKIVVPSKKDEVDKHAGKMKVTITATDSDNKKSNAANMGKGTTSSSVSKGKGQKRVMVTSVNATLPKPDVKGGKGWTSSNAPKTYVKGAGKGSGNATEVKSDVIGGKGSVNTTVLKSDGKGGKGSVNATVVKPDEKGGKGTRASEGKGTSMNMSTKAYATKKSKSTENLDE